MAWGRDYPFRFLSIVVFSSRLRRIASFISTPGLYPCRCPHNARAVLHSMPGPRLLCWTFSAHNTSSAKRRNQGRMDIDDNNLRISSWQQAATRIWPAQLIQLISVHPLQKGLTNASLVPYSFWVKCTLLIPPSLARHMHWHYC